jgi:hypothetical protein
MKDLMSLASVLGLGSLLLVGAARAEDTAGKDAPITIRGCLLAGTRTDTFVLNNLTSSVGDASHVIYWLSSTNGLKDHVGETIEVTGPVVGISEGELNVRTDPANSPDTTIEVKARGKEAKARTDGDADTKTTEERTMPVHRIKVQSIRMVSTTCS